MAHPFFKGKNFARRNRKVPSIKSLKGGIQRHKYDDYKDAYGSEENVSDDDSTSGSVRSMSFKSLAHGEGLLSSKRVRGRKQKSKFYNAIDV